MQTLDLKNSRTCLYLGILSLLIGILLRFSFATHIERTRDERVYQNFTNKLHQEGASLGTRSLIENYLNKPEDWIYPPPTRIAYYNLIYTYQNLRADKSIDTAAQISIFASILSLILLSIFTKFYFGNLAFALASIFAATSPLSLYVARRNWTESSMELLMLSLFIATFVVIKNKKVTIKPALCFFTIGLISFLFKESSYVCISIASLLGACYLFAIKKSRESIRFAILGLATTILGFLFLSFLVGGTSIIFTIYQNIKQTVPLNDYAVEYQSGGFLDFIKLYFIISPAQFLLALIATTWLFFRNIIKESSYLLNENFVCSVGVIAIVIYFMLLASIPQYFINLRYLSPTYSLIPILIACCFGDFSFTYNKKTTVYCFASLAIVITLAFASYDISLWKNFLINNFACNDFNIKTLANCGMANRY